MWDITITPKVVISESMIYDFPSGDINPSFGVSRVKLSTNIKLITSKMNLCSSQLPLLQY